MTYIGEDYMRFELKPLHGREQIAVHGDLFWKKTEWENSYSTWTMIRIGPPKRPKQFEFFSCGYRAGPPGTLLEYEP
jgi:hypothetical protein